MKVIGIDIGAANTKGVLFDKEKKEIIDYQVLPTEFQPKKVSQIIIEKLKDKNNYPIITTGVGRNLIEHQVSLTEITAIAKGINFLSSEVRTIIDIGGEDIKIIKIDNKGKVIDFIMNDRCASGTGRFFANLTKALKITFEEFNRKVLEYKNPSLISHLCVVMVESEVLSKIYQGEEISDVLFGVCLAVAKRIVSLAQGIKIEKKIALTGGGAKNLGLKKALEILLGEELNIPKEPLIVAALGAALAFDG
ncbi:MAG: acyl-CoA dehydratase activase [candidate division WOR-3 bacterium]